MNQVKKVNKSIKGKQLLFDGLRIDNKEIIATGKVIRTVCLKEEWDDDVENPGLIVEELKKRKFRTDLFTFIQRLPEIEPKYNYFMEWESIAALSVLSFDEWWKKLPKKTRQNIRNTEKFGVVVKPVDFNDEFVVGIMDIYNDTPIRQGKTFWHYGKDFNTVKTENSTYLDRCDFLGAYYNGGLIGFIKLVYSGKTANPMQILSKIEHRDDKLKPTSLLIAKAVHLCEQKKIPFLTYGLWGDGPLNEFKRRNGFERVLLPRYYIPLTIKGEMALKLNLHHGVIEMFPEKMIVYMKNMRKKLYEKMYKNNNTLL